MQLCLVSRSVNNKNFALPPTEQHRPGWGVGGGGVIAGQAFSIKRIWRQYFVGLSKCRVRFVWLLPLHHTSNTSISFVLVCGEPTLPHVGHVNTPNATCLMALMYFTKKLNCYPVFKLFFSRQILANLPVLSDTWLCIYKPLGQIAIYKQPVQPQ